MNNATFDVATANRILKENFAPWIQEMDIHFDLIANGSATLRVPQSERFNRVGGTICGQAIMTLADTAMVFAISSALGEFVPMTTVSQSTSFLRPASDADLIAHARIIKPGRTLMYGEVSLYTQSPEKPVSHVTSTYMLV